MKVSMPPLVSIITASFNTAKFINESIASVVAQSLTDWELIVVDDASADKSADVIRSWTLRDKRIRFLENAKNVGAAASRNRGIELATGRFICFLDSDDMWLPMKLEKQTHFMLAQNIELSYCDYQKMSEEGDLLGVIQAPASATYQELLQSNVIGCLTAMYDSSKLGKRYMPLIKKRQDYALWLSILRDGGVARGIPEVLARYRVRTQSLSGNKFSAACYQWKVYRDLEEIPFFSRLKIFSSYALRGLKKYLR